MTRKLHKKFYTILLMLGLFLMGIEAGVQRVDAGASLPLDAGTLTIHKYALDDMEGGGQPAEGSDSVSLPEGAVLVEGIEFSVWEVDISQGIPATAQEAKKQLITSSLAKQTTDDSGTVVFELERGLYYIEETDSVGRAITDLGEEEPIEQTFLGIVPFLAAVPMTNVSGDGWITDVHVYPKNQALTIDSFVHEVEEDYDYEDVMRSKIKPVASGELYAYSIFSVIPAALKNAVGSVRDSSLETGLGDYTITSQIPDGIDFEGNSAIVCSLPSVTTSYKEGHLLVSDVDYTQEYDSEARTLRVMLTQEGLRKLGQRYLDGSMQDRYLQVRFQAQLNDDARQCENIPVGATLTYVHNGRELSASVIEEPMVHTAQISIEKVDDEDTDIKLAQAEFGLAVSEEEAQAGEFFAVGVTDTDGMLIFKGIKFGEAGVDYSMLEECEDTFWLMETKAPNGYRVVPAPFEIVFAPQWDEEADEHYFARLTVRNRKTGVFAETDTLEPTATPEPTVTRSPQETGREPSTAPLKISIQTDEKLKQVRTGDFAPIAVWILIFLGAAGSVGAVFAYRWKKR